MARKTKAEKPTHYTAGYMVLDSLGYTAIKGFAPWCATRRELESKAVSPRASKRLTTNCLEEVTCKACKKAIADGRVAAGRNVVVKSRVRKMKAQHGKYAYPAWTMRYLLIVDVETGVTLSHINYATSNNGTGDRTQAQARQIAAEVAAKYGFNLRRCA